MSTTLCPPSCIHTLLVRAYKLKTIEQGMLACLVLYTISFLCVYVWESELECLSACVMYVQESELERLSAAREAETKFVREQNELEISKAGDMANIETEKFKNMVDAIGSETIAAIATAGPEMQVHEHMHLYMYHIFTHIHVYMYSITVTNT